MTNFFLASEADFNEDGQRVYHLPYDVYDYFKEIIAPYGLGELYAAPEMDVYETGEDGVYVDADYYTYTTDEDGHDEVLPLDCARDYVYKSDFEERVLGWGRCDSTDGSYVIIFDEE